MEKNKNRRCVIAGGADIGDYEFLREKLLPDDYVIYCDSGLKHMEGLNVKPGLIIGDFDSHEDPHMDVETIVLPCEKDDTDTVFAVKEGIRRGFEDFLLVGAVGARLDHTLGNVYLLEYLDSLGMKGCIIDDYSEMEMISGERVVVPDRYSFFSVLNITGEAKGITIENAKYPLSDAEITSGYQYGVSNEVLPGKEAYISVRSGKLLLIKVR
ncbi:MAG: thiamine diphosphokinase [Lachnospiraceae bacterium]|nr:thiamine diphosphokinase [Lachnospiraceae bacterium]